MRDKMSEMKKFKHFNPMKLREKYSAGSVKRTNNYSSFWMGNNWDTKGSIFDEVEDNVKPGIDHIALAGYRRAIANFVTIVTNDPTINVKFQDRGDSYTDGKKVMIGSKLEDKNFDSTVGLALHEGSHIKLSDFDFLRNLEYNTPTEIFLLGESKGFSKSETLSHIKNLLNYVEDRRIDYYIFSTSPGYKGYYHSMYEKYFHAKVIDKALLTDEYTSLDWDSYIFRIINMTNKNSRLDVLPGLNEIYNFVFKDNGGIKNMKTTEDASVVAVKILKMIYKIVPKVESESSDTSDSSGSSVEKGDSKDSVEMSDEDFQDLLDSVENGTDMESSNSDGEVSTASPKSESVPSSDFTPPKKSEVVLSDAQKKTLENAIKKQKAFNNGEVKKVGTLSKKDASLVKNMEASGVSYEEAGKGMVDDYGYVNKKGIKVLVVKKFTKAMVDEDMFPTLISHKYNRYEGEYEFVNKGISLGTKLGKKLQVRGESKTTKWSRLDNGHIDKRLIAELGFGNDRVFSTTFVESYSDAHLHISVDASGSMGGDKWTNTMTSVIAICKAASMIQNVDVVVSLRTTHYSTIGRGRSQTDCPMVMIAYDSRIDKFSKVKNMFGYLKPGGTTPEGLCYEAIMKEIVPASTDKESYFLNFSDGMPMFSTTDMHYYNTVAVNHTKKMVKEIKNLGINVLSYFIGDNYSGDRNMKDFKTMYGKDSEFINVTNVMEISKTMNKKFLAK
jgi:hypothetical protein